MHRGHSSWEEAEHRTDSAGVALHSPRGPLRGSYPVLQGWPCFQTLGKPASEDQLPAILPLGVPPSPPHPRRGQAVAFGPAKLSEHLKSPPGACGPSSPAPAPGCCPGPPPAQSGGPPPPLPTAAGQASAPVGSRLVGLRVLPPQGHPGAMSFLSC